MKKIAIYGISGNPIHIGHVMAIQYVSAVGGFDEILVIPAYVHPVKTDLVDYYHRFKMCQLGLGHIPKVIIDPIESLLPTPSYTLQTITELQKMRPARYSLVIGSDNLSNQAGWGTNLEKILKIVDPFILDRNIYDVSSTQVRNLIKLNDQDKLSRLCPTSIIEYIKEHDLYQNKTMKNQIINSFSGEYNFLSNFYEALQISDLKINNSNFRPCRAISVEHLFQAAKSLDLIEQSNILQAKTPGKAKKMGRLVKLRSDWESVKIDIMTQLVLDKFSQNPDLKQKLLDTGNIELIEGNTWGDKFWGVDGGEGKNHLGKILMYVREKLK